MKLSTGQKKNIISAYAAGKVDVQIVFGEPPQEDIHKNVNKQRKIYKEVFPKNAVLVWGFLKDGKIFRQKTAQMGNKYTKNMNNRVEGRCRIARGGSFLMKMEYYGKKPLRERGRDIGALCGEGV